MATQPQLEVGAGGGGFLSALPTMIWQRRWFVIIPLVVATLAGIIAAFLMKPVYESSATVLIEQQQLPDDLIGASPNGRSDLIGQRIARARERVLTRQDLIRLIRTYNLYPREQRMMPLSRVVDKMREDTSVQAVDTDLGGGARRNLGLANTIAISISFQYEDPIKAQQVAQQFVDSFLESDASMQASQAADTVNFLTEQANSMQAQIARLEQRANDMRSQNGPVLAMGTLSGNSSQDLAQVDAQIAGLQARIAQLQAGAAAGATANSAVAQAEAQLRVARAKFSESHPDVVAAKAQLEAAKNDPTSKGVDPTQGELAADRAQLASLRSARAMVASNSSNYQSAAARAPALSSQVEQLDKAADALRDQYRSVGAKLQAAQIQARMESEQKGERLTLSDPPVVPDRPLRPNRPLIVAGAIAAGLGIGLALVLLIELILRPIRGTAALRAITGEQPLAIIPDFDQRPSWIAKMVERRIKGKTSVGAKA